MLKASIKRCFILVVRTEAAKSEGIEGIHSCGHWFLCNFAKWKSAEHNERCSDFLLFCFVWRSLFIVVLLLKVHTAHGVKLMYTYFQIDSKIFWVGWCKALLKYEEFAVQTTEIIACENWTKHFDIWAACLRYGWARLLEKTTTAAAALLRWDKVRERVASVLLFGVYVLWLPISMFCKQYISVSSRWKKVFWCTQTPHTSTVSVSSGDFDMNSASDAYTAFYAQCAWKTLSVASPTKF